MNRLVITGNGFDLAHGLKTSYNDFFNWLWTYQLEISESTCNFDNIDAVTHCKITNDIFSLSFTTYDQLYNNDTVKVLYLNKISFWSNSFIDDNRNTISISYNSSNIFFNELLKHRHNTNQWADIEKTFFHILKRISLNNQTTTSIKEFNNNFESIKNLFEKFLSETVQKDEIKANHKIKKIILDREKTGGINRPDYIRRVASINILNFNYTNTPTIYSNTSNFIKTNYIHGELNSTTNPIIFGYGDERGEDYKQLELLDDNSVFEHIKSFAYLNTSNYSKLIQFIDSNKFDVVIIGHSCGLTDRTLLNTIFEHPNCTAIKPTYYNYNNGGDNYQEIVRNISRSFDDKTKMRKLIVDKTKTESIN